MGYDKASFLAGVAAGRAMKSFPMLKDSRIPFGLCELFWTFEEIPAILSTGEPSGTYEGIGVYDYPLYGTVRHFKYFLWNDSGNSVWKVVWVNDGRWDGLTDFNWEWRAFETSTTWASRYGGHATSSYHSGSIYWNDWDCFYVDNAALIPVTEKYFVGNELSLREYLSGASIVTIGSKDYVRG